MNEALVRRFGLPGPVFSQPLSGRREPLQYQACGLIVKVAQHPSVLIEITKLAGLDFDHGSVTRSAGSYLDWKNPDIRAGAQPSARGLVRIGEEELGRLKLDRVGQAHAKDLVHILAVLEQPDGIEPVDRVGRS